MADSITSASLVEQSVWDRGLQWPILEQNVFDGYATPKSTEDRGEHGKEVIFTYINDLGTAPDPIDEMVGPDAKVLSTYTASARMWEHGNTMKYTLLAAVTSGKLPVSQTLLTALGRNAAVTIDEIALNALNKTTVESGSPFTAPKQQYANAKTALNTVAKTDVLKTIDVETAYTELAANGVPTFGGGNYKMFVSPYQLHDLRQEVGSGGWREPRENTAAVNEELRRHEVGSWAGFDFVVSNKLERLQNGAGSGGSQAFTTRAIALGADGFVKVYSAHPDSPGAMPKIIVADPVDDLQRIYRVSWYGLFGYSLMTSTAVRHIITGTSLG